MPITLTPDQEALCRGCVLSFAVVMASGVLEGCRWIFQLQDLICFA